MAHKPQIQYINRFYTPGSEARQVAVKTAPERSPSRLPKMAPPKEQIRLQVDPVALCSLVVAVTMLLLMAVGMLQYASAVEEHEAVEQYLIQLQDKQAILEHDYRSGYDIAQIEEQALAIGMIPIEEATTLTVKVDMPQPEPEPTMWDDVVWFLEGLFA